jgi:hypothetical protein
MRHYHVFGLKAASQANARALIRDEHGFERLLWCKTFQFFRNAIDVHLIGLFLIVLSLYEPQGLRQHLGTPVDFFIVGVFVFPREIEHLVFYFGCDS